MNEVFNTLKKLIDDIQSIYTEINNEWFLKKCTKLNLKKCQVADIDIDGTIYKNVMDYIQFLNEHSSNIILLLSCTCSYSVTSRVKAQNSIEYKIRNYKTEKHEYGKIPINKCLNDLFGIRIILEIPLTFNELSLFIETAYQGKYKCINSSKLDYKATHIYFKKDNQSFPWELQIWNSCDKENNFSSHKKYKQEYIIWEKENREGGIGDD